MYKDKINYNDLISTHFLVKHALHKTTHFGTNFGAAVCNFLTKDMIWT